MVFDGANAPTLLEHWGASLMYRSRLVPRAVTMIRLTGAPVIFAKGFKPSPEPRAHEPPGRPRRSGRRRLSVGGEPAQTAWPRGPRRLLTSAGHACGVPRDARGRGGGAPLPVHGGLRLLLRAIPGRRWDPEERVWRVPLHPERAHALTTLLETVPYRSRSPVRSAGRSGIAAPSARGTSCWWIWPGRTAPGGSASRRRSRTWATPSRYEPSTSSR